MNSLTEPITNIRFWAMRGIGDYSNLDFFKFGSNYFDGERFIKKDLPLGEIFSSLPLASIVQIVKSRTCDRFIKWIGKSELAKFQNQGGQI